MTKKYPWWVNLAVWLWTEVPGRFLVMWCVWWCVQAPKRPMMDTEHTF